MGKFGKLTHWRGPVISLPHVGSLKAVPNIANTGQQVNTPSQIQWRHPNRSVPTGGPQPQKILRRF